MKRTEDGRGRRARMAWAIALLLAFCQAAPAWGVQPVLWRDDTQESFLQAETAAISVDRDGSVRLAPALTQVADTGAGFVWALAEGEKGTVYAATGSPAAVFEISGGLARTVFASSEAALFSVAAGSDGAVFAGSSPGGLIFRLRADGRADTLCQTGSDHVWAVVPDGSGGVYAAVGGEAGRLLRVSASGAVSELYRTSDPNFVSLIRAADGRLYAGTDANGLVYRLDADGAVRVLYDAREKEIRALALGSDGILYAAAMTGHRQRPTPKSASGPQPSPTSGGSGGGEHAALYAIRPSGSAVQLWEPDSALLLHVAEAASGDLLVGTGEPGAVYRVQRDGSPALVAHLKDVGAWSFCGGQDGVLWIGSAGSGAVYRLGAQRAGVGTVTSKPRDFSLVSRWGRVAWHADVPRGASVSFRTRSGNSEVPDDTWSPWSEPVETPGARIGSPPARFLQYRLEMAHEGKGEGPVLREVRLSGLQENLPPMIVSLDASPMPAARPSPGGGKPSGAGDSSGGANTPPANGVWKVVWSAADVNGDELVYDLSYRGRGERNWKRLAEDLSETSYTWHVQAAPEGTMELRVVASDRKHNPSATALTAERVSAPFDIDHTAPVVRVRVKAGPRGTATVDCAVEDLTSPLKSAAYAVDSQDWQVAFPEDGIFDARSEALRLSLDGLTAGEHAIVVRAVDVLGNVGVGRAVFRAE